MEVRQSAVLNKLRSGDVVICTKINTADSRVIEIASAAGFDCVWTDMEHIGNDFSVIEKQVLAAHAHGADIVVRTARGSYSNHVRPLELNADGIMVPHVMNLSDAENVIRMTRFHPIGRRPVDGGNADGGYCGVAFQDYLKQSNERKFVMMQIEDPEALDDLEAICSLPGVDVIFFGPADFSHGLGAPGDFKHPKVLHAKRTIAEMAVKHGKYAGTVGTAGDTPELYELGYRFISIGADVAGLKSYFSGLMAAYFEKIPG